jgi:hypothetical protein
MSLCLVWREGNLHSLKNIIPYCIYVEFWSISLIILLDIIMVLCVWAKPSPFLRKILYSDIPVLI